MNVHGFLVRWRGKRITCGTGLACVYTWHTARPQYYAAMRWKNWSGDKWHAIPESRRGFGSKIGFGANKEGSKLLAAKQTVERSLLKTCKKNLKHSKAIRNSSKVSHPFVMHWSCITFSPHVSQHFHGRGSARAWAGTASKVVPHQSHCSWGHSRRYFFLLFGFDARHAGSYDSLGEVYLYIYLFTNLAFFSLKGPFHAFRDSWRHLNQDRYFTQNHPNWPAGSLWILGEWLWLSFIFPSFWR